MQVKSLFFAVLASLFCSAASAQAPVNAIIQCINGAGAPVPCSSVEVCIPLTVTASAYTSGNVFGNATGSAAGSAIAVPIPNIAAGQVLQSVRLDFKSVQTAEFDIYQFSAVPGNNYTDKSAPAIATGDKFNVLPPIKLTSNASGLGTHTVYGQDATARSLARSTATDYFVIIVIGTPTPASTTDAQFCASYL